MKWIVILFLLFSVCKKQKPVVNYDPLTEAELKCVFKNVKPIGKNSSEINEDFVVVFDGKYYKWTDPKFQECLKKYNNQN